MSIMEKENNEKDITIFEEYEIAKESGNLNDYYLRLFKFLDEKYSDDLPDVDVRTLIGITEKGKWDTPSGSGTAYKCQANYIIMFASWLKSAVEDSIIENIELIEQITNFQSHKFNFEKGAFTSKIELDMINDIIDAVIIDTAQGLEKG
jgi:hypothetical protein